MLILIFRLSRLSRFLKKKNVSVQNWAKNYFLLQIQFLNFSPLEMTDFAYSSYFPECLTTRNGITWTLRK